MTTGEEENQILPEDLSPDPQDPAEDILPQGVADSPAEEAGPATSPETGSEAEPFLDEASATGVEELLAAELGAGELETLPLPDAPLLLQGPAFQLRILRLEEGKREAMKKALEAQGVTISEKGWNGGGPVVSQLSEYQAVALLRAARSLGGLAQASLQDAASSPTEEDLALGDLSLVPDATAQPVSEGAPSVLLPRDEKEVMLCTPDLMPGITVKESQGILLAHRSIARRLFREDEAQEKLQKELQSLSGRPNAPLPSSHLQLLLRELFQELRKKALSKGANAVLGIKLEAFPESGGSDPQLDQLRLVAFGTAAVVEKV